MISICEMGRASAIDPFFRDASPFLKSVLTNDIGRENCSIDHCLDIPCGNGRNTFLLASYFKRVVAIDNNQGYLDSLDEGKIAYKQQNIQSVQQDILNHPLQKVERFGLICNIHFYHESLIRQLLSTMRKSAMLLIETPACHGENFRALPNEVVLNELFKKCSILRYEFRICKNADNQEQRGALKALIKR